MRHAIAHEIHHIGQLSIWARELGRKPVSVTLSGGDFLLIRQNNSLKSLQKQHLSYCTKGAV